jgi:capsid protein
MSLPAQVTEHDPHHETVRDVIARIETELEKIAHSIDVNHAHIAVAVGDAISGKPGFIRAMQEGDLIYQKVAGIAGFLRSLMEVMPQEWEVETGVATRDVKLAELASKIGARHHAVDVVRKDEFGDCDMF